MESIPFCFVGSNEEVVKNEEVMVVKKVKSEKKQVQDNHNRGYTLFPLDILWDTRSCRLSHHLHIQTHRFLFHGY